jgi:hypothetical protein
LVKEIMKVSPTADENPLSLTLRLLKLKATGRKHSGRKLLTSGLRKPSGNKSEGGGRGGRGGGWTDENCFKLQVKTNNYPNEETTQRLGKGSPKHLIGH